MSGWDDVFFDWLEGLEKTKMTVVPGSFGAENGTAMELIKRLDDIRSRTRRLLQLRGLGIMSAAIFSLCTLFIIFDWLFRFPSSFRLFLLAILVFSLIWLCIRQVIPAVLFKPTPTEIALQIEQVHTSESGHIASAIDFLENDLHK